MKKFTGLSNCKDERGNILFIILIAVALFAALSYAVTQSSRSGGGNASSEKTLVNSSQLNEYPTNIRTSVIRMTIGTGITLDQLLFNPPSDFGTAITVANQKYSVFQPAGGGAVYQQAAPELMAASGPNATVFGTWHYNAKFQVQNVGTTTTGANSDGNDVVAFLNGVSKAVCQGVNTQLGLGGVPSLTLTVADINSDQLATSNGATISTFPAAVAGTLINAPALNSQPFGCFLNTTDGAYVYYHTVIER